MQISSFNKFDEFTGCDSVPGKRYVPHSDYQFWNSVERPEWCPLVPLPEGHGRLGDLDRLFEVMGQDVDRWIVEEVSMIETDDVLDAIHNAPTIIEADLEWKMKNCCCFSNTDQAEGGTDNG